MWLIVLSGIALAGNDFEKELGGYQQKEYAKALEMAGSYLLFGHSKKAGRQTAPAMLRQRIILETI